MKSLICLDIDRLKRIVARTDRRKDGHLQDTIRKAIRKLKILERDGFQCVACGEIDRLTIDHFKKHPTQHKFRNAVAYNPNFCKTLCVSCHKEKNRLISGRK